MITYVNSKEAKLFELAAKDLGLESLDIDQYLNKLAELKAISPKYVRLPLYEEGHEDEEIFEIDANARTIKVPASFSKNGVGVVSDELAETVWFKINRYFDIKDFGKAAGVIGDELKDGNLHILIQWEAPDGAKGASWAYAIDVDTDPDFVYFGWALTAEHLTAKAGNIKFAVRIMEYDGDVIAYSFATQAAQIAVKAGLGFDLTDDGIEFESVADKIANRLMGGQIAHCPVFAENGNLPPYFLELGEENILSVIAAAPEGEEYDAMAYKWYKKGANDADFAQLEGEYKPALAVNSSGKYYVVVFGMKEIVDGMEYIYDEANDTAAESKFKYHTSVASSKSIVCEIPAPIKLEIIEDMAGHVIIANNAVILMEIERQMIGEDPVGEVELRIEKTATAEKDLDLDNAEFAIVGEPSEGSPAVPAVEEAWIFRDVEYASEDLARAACDDYATETGGIADYNEITHREAVEGRDAVPAHGGVTYEIEDGAVTIHMDAADEGYYRITVINKLNGDQEETASEVICRAVKPAAFVAESAIATPKRKSGAALDEGEEPNCSDEYKVVAEVEVDGLSDELYIKWYNQKGQLDPAEEDTPDEVVAEGLFAERNAYTPTVGGYYYFIATNMVADEENVAEIRSNAVHFAN